MNVTAKIDEAEWRRSIEQIYRLLKRKTLPEILNRSAGSVAIKAGMAVRRSSKRRIERYFAQRARAHGGGRDKRFPGSIAYAIYRAKKGARGVLGEGDVSGWVQQRINSANVLRMGFFAAASAFSQWLKTRSRFRPRRSLGWGTPANPSDGWQCEAQIHHAVPVKNKAGGTAIVEAATQSAIARETQQLRAQAERMIQQDLRRFVMRILR